MHLLIIACTHSLDVGWFSSDVILLHKETCKAVVMEEQVWLLHQAYLLPFHTGVKHHPNDIKWILKRGGGRGREREGGRDGEGEREGGGGREGEHLNKLLAYTDLPTILMCFFAFLTASMATSSLRGVSGSSEAVHKVKLFKTCIIKTSHLTHAPPPPSPSFPPAACPAPRPWWSH